MSQEQVDDLVIAGCGYRSRLLVGTGKFASHETMRDSLLASGAQIVTVALRRVDLERLGAGDVLDFVPAEMTLLPNTSGAVDASEAHRLARLGRAATGTDLVKLEVTPDPRTLAPDPIETLRAAELLVADGFTVLPYCSADPVLARVPIVLVSSSYVDTADQELGRQEFRIGRSFEGTEQRQRKERKPNLSGVLIDLMN